MRFLAISTTTPAATPERLQQEMGAEVAYGKQLFAQGFMLQGYMDPTYTIAYLIVEASTQAEAEATLAHYPLAQSGVITYAVYPLIGLPAVAEVLQEQHQSLPSWWPTTAQG